MMSVVITIRILSVSVTGANVMEPTPSAEEGKPSVTVDQATQSRAQRQAQTREKLIEVAREMFLTDGYAASSLDKVAIAAGFSKGAVYSNFSGKEELCMAVLDSIHEEQIEGVVNAFAGDGDLDSRIDAFTAWAREGIGQPRWTALEVEFAAVARRSPYVATELVKRHREISEALADLIRRVTKEAGISLPLSAEQAAVGLLGMGIGLGAMRSLDGSIDVDVFGTMMRALLRP
jgi:AcrR family transcriptional regulator